MISVTAAVQQIAACRTNWGAEFVPLEQAVGRVLAEAVIADRDYPPFHRAARDGFAVRIADLHAHKRYLPVSHSLRPGEVSTLELLPGHAVKVWAGAVLPPDVDAVVGVEETEEKNGHVVFTGRELRSYQHMIRRGEDAVAGLQLLQVGTRIHFQHLALLAALGVANVKVCCQPRTVIISAGNSLRTLGVPVGEDQLRDANSYSVNGLLEQYGIQPEARFIVPEHAPSLQQVIRDSLEADLLVISGGLEVGESMMVPRLLQQCGVEQVFHRVRAKLCKSFWFGYSPTKTRVMAFPGNAFSVQVGCKLFLESYIRSCWGLPLLKPWLLPFLEHRGAVHPMDEYVPAQLVNRNGLKVKGLHFSGEGDITAAARADGFICHSTDAGNLEPGSLVPFFPWTDHLSAGNGTI